MNIRINQLFSSVGLVVLLLSCNQQKQSPEEIQNETPDAIEAKYEPDWSSSYKRGGYDNIIERLYKEAIKKNKEVHIVNESIELANNYYNDSLVDYNKYLMINEDYWKTANTYISSIADSTLRVTIKNAFDKAESDYCTSKEHLLSLNDKIEIEKQHFDNQVILMKLLVTLPMIQNYQKNEIPDSLQMNSVKNELENTIKKIETFVK